MTIVLSALLGCVAMASTIDPAQPAAWGANAGWINFLGDGGNGTVVGDLFLGGYAWAANLGWIHLGDGSPANGYAYSNLSAGDCGVNHDGAGNLGGYAYGANIGWIYFGWAGAGDPNRPRFDLLTGEFSGYAYGANVGWINLGTGNLSTSVLDCPDTDSDGIGDAWEWKHFGGLGIAGIGTDRDKDGVSDAAEFAADTDPNNWGEYLRIVSAQLPAPGQVTLVFRTTRPSRLYRIQSSTTLGNSSWSDVGSAFYADPGVETTRTVSFVDGPRRFWRVVATKPLAP